MTLVSMLRGKNENDLKLQKALELIKPLKTQFYTLSKNNPFSKQYIAKAENKLETTAQAAVVGTAFDYMARFIICKYTNMSENSLQEILDNLISTRIFRHLSFRINEETYDTMSIIYKDFLMAVVDYRNDKDLIPNKKVIEATIKMARLEAYYRSGILTDDSINNFINKEKDILISDLENLAKVFIEDFINSDLITPESTIIYNPTFGEASDLVGGADADIYIDGVLYDFKSTKSYGYSSKEAMQLVGYYLLAYISINDKESSFFKNPINKIAFYKARFGEVEFFDMDKINKEELEKAVQIVKHI